MIDVLYNPDDVGKTVTSPRGNQIILRKYHMTPKEMVTARKRFEHFTINVPQSIKDKAGPMFFNPYRMGIYYGQIQALYLLGCNEWHEYPAIQKEIEKFLDSITIIVNKGKDKKEITIWQKFISKSPKSIMERSKDVMGRIQENMVFFQRLTKLHPSGYKLRQVYSAVDIKRVSRIDFPNGLFFYRLSTYKTMEEAIPIRDYTEFAFPKNENKFVSRKFLGKIVTREKTILCGSEDEMS